MPLLTSRYPEVAERFRRLKKALDMPNDAAMAARLGMAPQKLNNYMHGRSRPDLETGLAIVRVTGVSLDWIYNGVTAGLTVQMAEKLEVLPPTPVKAAR